MLSDDEKYSVLDIISNGLISWILHISRMIKCILHTVVSLETLLPLQIRQDFLQISYNQILSLVINAK